MEVAILTGDIIESSNLMNKHREELPVLLKKCFHEIKAKESRGVIEKQFEIFRGDSFQGMVKDVKRSLPIALKIIAYLKMQPPDSWDYFRPETRIAIGLGKVDLKVNKLVESDGEALRISGKLLDKMKEENQEIGILSSDGQLNKQLEIISLLLNVIIQQWTTKQALVIYNLMNGYNQTEIADQLGVSQPSINQSARSGNWKEIYKALIYFNSLFQ